MDHSYINDDWHGGSLDRGIDQLTTPVYLSDCGENTP